MVEQKIYRLGYDQLFLASPEVRKGNETITALSILLQYKLYDIENDLEILFAGEDLENQSIGKEMGWYSEEAGIPHRQLDDVFISNFIECSLDKYSKNYIKINILEDKLKNRGYRLEYEIAEYYKDMDEKGISIPIKISKEEFINIMKENLNNFDNKNNKPTQSTSYETFLILEETKNEIGFK